MPIWTPRLGGSSASPIYRRIVQSIADDIASGQLSTGERLPPHRDLADELGVARGTIAKAYDEARKLGLVRSGVGSGTYVQTPDSESRPYSTLLEPPIVFNDLTTNYPMADIDPDPADAFQELALRPDRQALLRYQSNLGMRRHRLAGVQWVDLHGVETDIDGVILCSGAQHALFVTLAHLLEPEDVILVEEWSYPGLHGIAETLRVRLVAVEMNRGGLSISALERACRRHNARVLYCMPTVHNPTGAVLSTSRRRSIARLARRFDLAIIEDDANRLLVPDAPSPIQTFAPERTYFIASTSKILSAGLRVAFLVAPREEIERIARHVWSTQWMVSPLGAEVFTIWLERGVVEETLSRKLREAKRRQKLARRVLHRSSIMSQPSTLHLWLELPPCWKAERLVSELRHWNIAVTPSSAFWMRGTEPPQAIRIALGGVDNRTTLEKGLTTLAEILASP